MNSGSFPPSNGVYIIAEAGVNHNGDVAIAKKLIDEAVAAGADAVKFQIFDPVELASTKAPLTDYQQCSGETSQIDMLNKLALSRNTFAELADYAKKKGIDYIVSPFDSGSAAFLATLDVPAIKIPSCEAINLPFLRDVAALGLPVILSTGTCNLEEVDEAVSILKDASVSLVVLHCTSAYPTPYEQVNLRAMETLTKKFDVPVGLSDHSEGTVIPIAAAALGAVVIEKHFTLDRNMQGPDHQASIEPDELKAMVEGIRAVQAALGSPEKVLQPDEENTATVARRSVVAITDLVSGEIVTADNTALKRPGTGIPPKEYQSVIGKVLNKDITSGTPITYDMLS